jgi:hypothetical protein
MVVRRRPLRLQRIGDGSVAKLVGHTFATSYPFRGHKGYDREREDHPQRRFLVTAVRTERGHTYGWTP